MLLTSRRSTSGHECASFLVVVDRKNVVVLGVSLLDDVQNLSTPTIPGTIGKTALPRPLCPNTLRKTMVLFENSISLRSSAVRVLIEAIISSYIKAAVAAAEGHRSFVLGRIPWLSKEA